MNDQRHPDDVTRGLPGVKRAIWVLENGSHTGTDRTKLIFLHPGNIRAAKYYFPGCRFIKTQYAPPDCRFTAAAFTHQAECFVFLYGKTDIIDGFYLADLAA